MACPSAWSKPDSQSKATRRRGVVRGRCGRCDLHACDSVNHPYLGCATNRSKVKRLAYGTWRPICLRHMTTLFQLCHPDQVLVLPDCDAAHHFWVLTNFKNDVRVKMSYKQ